MLSKKQCEILITIIDQTQVKGIQAMKEILEITAEIEHQRQEREADEE